MLRSWFEWVDAFPSSIAFRESLYGYPFLLTTHVISMCLFAGLVVMMDLRLVGIGNRRTPISEIQRRLFPWQMVGFTVNLITGALLFYGQPMRYYGKALYWTKMSLMILAGINALVFHLTTYRSVRDWDTDPVPPVSARLAGYFGLFLWAGVVAFGRLTAYDWFTYR
jgi:uncharacterized protein DUF6644